MPGGRAAAAAWTDKAGNLWLFGGYGFDSTGSLGLLDDLWKFSPSSGQWTWMGGSNSMGLTGSRLPGAYGEWMTPSATSWTDSQGKFWLFGGDGYDSASVFGGMNDLWTFDPVVAQWTWISGSSTTANCFWEDRPIGSVWVAGRRRAGEYAWWPRRGRHVV